MKATRQWLVLAIGMMAAGAAAAERVTEHVTTAMSALDAYEWGFAFDVMRTPDGKAVHLNDLILFENDGPGAGFSEKGTFREELHAGVQAKKWFDLDDPMARRAHVVIYMEPPGSGEPPSYHLRVNGRRVEGIEKPWHDGRWHWVPVPVDALRAGSNEFVVASDAPEGQGYTLLIAREDEYEAGGGRYTVGGNTALISSGQLNPGEGGESSAVQEIHVGETSAKSTDGGQTWTKFRLGGTHDVVGEYTIRLHLERYKPGGYLRSAPIDLWARPNAPNGLLPASTVSKAAFRGYGKTPPGTAIEWAVRFADTPDPHDPAWGPFVPVDGAGDAAVALDAQNRRYLQWEARLSTADPLVSPVVEGVEIARDVAFTPPPRHQFYVRESVNPRPRYSTYHFAYEDSGRQEFAALRDRLGLDELVEGATGDFDLANRLRYHVSKQWYHGNPMPGYPEWNALEILDRRDDLGYGGMCIQFSITYIQALGAMGYQARHVNIFNHESVELWVDELGKWVHIDPESVFDSYEFHTETGEPLNMREQHAHFLARYGFSKENPIDWMSTEPWTNRGSARIDEVPQPLDISTFTPWINNPDPSKRPPQHGLVGFLRMMPRNDYFSRPTPRPLSQGSTYWPWNGYVNWYDDATPRHLQYALHTDRVADFWPTLNRVHFTASHTANPSILAVEMTTYTPNFARYEINLNDTGWKPADAAFEWALQPSAFNTIEMRTVNALGVTGKPSKIVVLWNYQEPYQPKPEKR